MKKIEWIMVFLLIGVLSVSSVLGAPSGPSDVTVVGSSNYAESAAVNISAIAGNVTELNFEANTASNTWQGYFGNVTGTIVLGNANNQSLYNWNLSSPSGEIYATRVSSVPAWSTVRCADQSEVDAEDIALGVDSAVDQDAVNKTFLNTTSFNSFFVGNVNINSTQNCRATQLNDENGVPSSAFAEVLLSDSVNMIYTGLITTPTVGFDNREHQFQMLVGEDGHNDDATATPYYFYLELQ